MLILRSKYKNIFFHTKSFAIIFIAITIFILGCEPEPSITVDPDEILKIEQQRIDFLTSREYDQLAEVLSPTMSYTHSNAKIDNKDAFLEVLRDGSVIYQSMDHQDVDVRFINSSTAIMNGITDVVVTIEGDNLEVPLRFTIVYAKMEGKWMLEAWHSVSRSV